MSGAPLCRGRQSAVRACFSAYRAAAAPPVAGATALPAAAVPPWWPQRPPGMSLSYVAMCYTLLHELGPVADVFKRQPQLWEAASLEECSAAAWGWLEEA